MEDEQWSQHVAEAMYVARFNAQLTAIEVSKIFATKGTATKRKRKTR